MDGLLTAVLDVHGDYRIWAKTTKSWTARAYPKLIYYNKLDKGGHFAAWAEPQLFSAEVRAAFKSLRH